MQAYKYNSLGEFEEIVNCQLDPLETLNQRRNVYLLPANATYEPPLEEKDGFKVKFDGAHWIYEEIPQPEPLPEPTYRDLRAAEYPSYGEQFDLIYWDKVNGTNNWQEKIAEIKAKYPKEEVNA